MEPQNDIRPLVSERLPELRGMFERILCAARSSDQKPVGNIELADRLIKAVVAWGALPLPSEEVEELVGPTDKELESFLLDVAAEHGDIYWAEPLVLARAVLARWGRPAPAPAGEVAELVEWLERERNAHGPMAAYADVRGRLARIATLLRQLSAAAPHPVPELEPTLREEFTMILNEARCNSPGRVIGNIELGRRLVAAVERFNSQPPGRVEALAGDSQHQQVAPVPADSEFPRLHHCPTHGRQPENAWGCPECVRELRQQSAQASAAMIPMEYVHLGFDGRIVCEPSEEKPGVCWRVLNSRFVNPFTEFPTAEAACNALQAAHALPLPSGEVE